LFAGEALEVGSRHIGWADGGTAKRALDIAAPLNEYHAGSATTAVGRAPARSLSFTTGAVR